MSSQPDNRGFVVVTGTSTGIGAATALHLADQGFHVVAGVRRKADGDTLQAQAPERLTPLIIEVTDEATISYLESPAAKTVLNGKPFACASISRRYYSINLRQQKKLGEKDGGRWIAKTHFVAAGGQVKSMLSWLGYMKHGEPQERVMGLKMPPPNLKPDFEEQARSFIDSVADRVLGQPAASNG
jgi:hypothetical protein